MSLIPSFSSLRESMVNMSRRFPAACCFAIALSIALIIMVIVEEYRGVPIYYCTAAFLLSLMLALWNEEYHNKRMVWTVTAIAHILLLIDAIYLWNLDLSRFSAVLYIARAAVYVAFALGILFLSFYKEKNDVARLIGSINWHYRDQKKHMMLIVPGRVGTTSPELGVPTAFSDISAFEIICETEERQAGYNPELSYGSHIFQDLVEAEILYTAVFHSEKTIRFQPDQLKGSPDIVDQFDHGKELAEVVHVYDVSGRKCEVYHDVANEHLLITC